MFEFIVVHTKKENKSGQNFLLCFTFFFDFVFQLCRELCSSILCSILFSMQVSTQVSTQFVTSILHHKQPTPSSTPHLPVGMGKRSTLFPEVVSYLTPMVGPASVRETVSKRNKRDKSKEGSRYCSLACFSHKFKKYSKNSLAANHPQQATTATQVKQ